MPRNLAFLADYADPAGSPLSTEEATAIDDRMTEDEESWTEIDSWQIHSVSVGVFTDGERHVVLRRVERPAPGARERYDTQMAEYLAVLKEAGIEPEEPKIWDLDTVVEQLTGFTGYADEDAAVQDGLRLVLGAVIAHQDEAVRDWCGWREDVVILAQSHGGGARSSAVLRVHAEDGRIDCESKRDILRAYSTYADAVQEVIDDLGDGREVFDGLADSSFARRIVQAWLARSAANAMLERARHVLLTSADNAARTTADREKAGLVAALAIGLHTDRPNLYRVIPQMKQGNDPDRAKKR